MVDSELELLVPSGFEWDEDKSNANLVKHGISFDDASDIFYGPVKIQPQQRGEMDRDRRIS
jgi:uncharacterized DUF497 family protein